MKTALELFRAGPDTAQIAHILRISEALALEMVCKQRSAELGKSSPYRDAPASLSVRPRARPLIRYAGR